MKRLISVVDIKTLSEKGQTEFMVDDDTLITPAARDAANEFGVKIVKAAAPAVPRRFPQLKLAKLRLPMLLLWLLPERLWNGPKRFLPRPIARRYPVIVKAIR